MLGKNFNNEQSPLYSEENLPVQDGGAKKSKKSSKKASKKGSKKMSGGGKKSKKSSKKASKKASKKSSKKASKKGSKKMTGGAKKSKKSVTSYNNSTRNLLTNNLIYSVKGRVYKINPKYAFNGSSKNRHKAVIEMLSICKDC